MKTEIETVPEVLRWSGMMGHRVITIEPEPTGHGTYGAFRCVCEGNDLNHDIEDAMKKPGQQVWLKVGKNWRRKL